MLETVKAFAKQHELINNSDQIALAISGGRDSVALAHLLNAWQRPFMLLHCNYGLRGTESDLDEQFVKELAAHLSFCSGVLVKSFKREMQNVGSAIQEKARNLRYQWFQDLYNDGYFTKLLTAHHRDDSLETFFINLSRVSGIRGLSGISIQRDFIVRPLLCVNRVEINAYLGDNAIDYREDQSNAENKYLRNKIRNRILPTINKEINEFSEKADLTIGILKEEKKLLETLVNEKISDLVKHRTDRELRIAKNGLLGFPHPTVLLYQILNTYGFNYAQCQQIIASITHAGVLFSSSTHDLVIESESLYLKKRNTIKPDTAVMDKPGHYSFGEWKIELQKVKTPLFSENPFEEFLCLCTKDFPLELRLCKQGDKIQPLGMTGSKLVSDVLTDAKVNRLQKEETPVLTAKNDVIWVIGHCLSDRYKVGSGKTLYRISAKKK